MTNTECTLIALAGSLTASTLAAVLDDLAEKPASKVHDLNAFRDLAARTFAEQLVCLEGDDAAERLRPVYRQSPTGPMKVQRL